MKHKGIVVETATRRIKVLIDGFFNEVSIDVPSGHDFHGLDSVVIFRDKNGKYKVLKGSGE